MLFVTKPHHTNHYTSGRYEVFNFLILHLQGQMLNKAKYEFRG